MRLKRIALIAATLTAALAVAVYATLSSLSFEELRGIGESRVRAATGRELKIAGPVDLQISWNPAITLEEVSFANAPWGSYPSMLTMKRMEAKVALLPLLFGDVRIRRLVLIEPNLLLETDRDGRGNWLLAETAPTGAAGGGEAAKLPSFSEVTMTDGRIDYRDGRTGRTLRLHVANLRAQAADQTSPVQISLAGSANDTPFTLDGVLGSPATLAANNAFPVKVGIESAGARLEVDGRIEQPLTRQALDVAVAAKGASLADLNALTGASLPQTGPFSFAAQVKRDGQEAKAMGVAIRVGGSDLAGSMRAEFSGSRPVISGKLAAGVLDLADLSPAAEGAQAPMDEGAAFIFPDTPLPLDALAVADADIALTAGALRLRPGIELNDLDMRLALKDGRLTIEPLAAQVSGGAAAGGMTLDGRAEPPAFALRLQADGVDYGRLLAAMGIADGVAGTLRTTVDVSGMGASQRAIAAGLNGRIDVVAGEGRIDSKLLRTAGTGLLDMFSRWEAEGEDLRLNCALARLPFRAGVSTSEAILLDTATVTVGGQGTADLRDETLDFKITPQAKQASLLSLAVPFRISGTLRQPEIGPDPLGTAVGAAKVAGILLNPLVAGATILLESETAERNPCVAALERGEGAAGSQAQPQGGIVDKATQGVTDTLKGAGEGLEKGLKSLFGN